MSTARKVVHLPTSETYALWAPTYDMDGNILQALDSHGLSNLLCPRLLRLLSPPSAPSPFPLQITDLGCGTGRASLLLLSALQTAKNVKGINLLCLDFSVEMLQRARSRVREKCMEINAERPQDAQFMCKFQQFDILAKDISNEVGSSLPRKADVVTSTLVLEHIPLEVYFSRARELLKPGGLLLVTNMHEDMGTAAFSAHESNDADAVHEQERIPTGAGFIDAATNTKIRGESFAHTMREVLSAAKDAGFELVGEDGQEQPVEIAVERWMLDGEGRGEPLLGERGRKWIGRKCWWGMILRLGS